METRRPALSRDGRRRRPRSEQVAENRDRLLDAAARVFRELGYTGASLDAIAAAAGFSKGAVYSHFDSKADLFLSLLEDRIDGRRQEQLATAAQDARRLADIRYRGGATSYLEVLDADTRLFAAEIGLAQAREAELASFVEVYRALGAGDKLAH